MQRQRPRLTWSTGQSFLTTPMPARPLSFNLSLDDPSFGDEDMQQLEDSDSRLVQMLAHQARLKNDNAGDEAKVVADDKLSHEEKREALQGLFTLATSNGELERVKRLLEGKAREYIDIDGVDAAHKLAILAALAFGRPVDFSAVHVEGIREVSALDISLAAELGYRIKLLGLAARTPAGISARVHPCMVPVAAPIARVDGVYNAVVAEGDHCGRIMLEGRGAGAGARRELLGLFQSQLHQ